MGEEDFANYSCEATNSLGKARAMVQLRGNPGPPQFSGQVGAVNDLANDLYLCIYFFSVQVQFVKRSCYRLVWQTLSYQRIQQYRLQWRRAGVGVMSPLASCPFFRKYYGVIT